VVFKLSRAPPATPLSCGSVGGLVHRLVRDGRDLVDLGLGSARGFIRRIGHGVDRGVR
jgi:hypothetical protein